MRGGRVGAERAEAPAGPDPQAVAIARSLARRAAAAARDLRAFFPFVMREEFTRDRLRLVPHHELVLEFVSYFPRCLVRMPVGFGKTFLSVAIALFRLGVDPTKRAAFVSATAGQAEKPLSMIGSYIEHSAELRAVFPALRPTQRREKWTNSALTVDRPRGIRDPSIVAAGTEARVHGSRLSDLCVDDVVDDQSTATAAARERLDQQFARNLLSRRDVQGATVTMLNTPWHQDDLTYRTEKRGWPSLTMDAVGNVFLKNVEDTGWASDLLRPSVAGEPEDERGRRYRLTAHDSERYGAPACLVSPEGLARRISQDEVVPAGSRVAHFDIDDEVVLWPEKFSREALAELWKGLSAAQVNQQYLMRVRDEESAPCKVEWIERCKELGWASGCHGFASSARGAGLRVTGIDLGIGLGKKHDFTCFFTAELVPELAVLEGPEGHRKIVVYRNLRRVLDVEFGRWSGAEIVDRLVRKHDQFGSVLVPESNAAQKWIGEWALERSRSLPILNHVTGLNKHDAAHGVSSLFQEFQNGGWIFPANRSQGERRGLVCPSPLERAISECLQYQPPPAHTHDLVMAWWICREKLRELGGSGGHFPGSVDVGQRVRQR